MERAVFAMGCFWGAEKLFGDVYGVISTRVGYTGGDTENPTYENLDGHTESVEVRFDTKKVTYAKLLKRFFENHDYNAVNKAQYKSAIFYLNDTQRRLAEGMRPEGAATEILPLNKFWEAEERHQEYYKKHKSVGRVC